MFVKHTSLQTLSYLKVEFQVFSPKLNELLPEICSLFLGFLAQAEPNVRTRSRGAITRIQTTDPQSHQQTHKQTGGHPSVFH